MEEDRLENGGSYVLLAQHSEFCGFFLLFLLSRYRNFTVELISWH